MASKFNRILVPLDGSGHSERAMPWALALAGDSAELVFLAVVPDAYELRSFGGQVISDADDLRAKYDQKAQAQLDEIISKWCPDRANVTSVIASGEPAEQIVQTATESDSDIIVISSRGQGSAGRFVSGTVADAVVQSSAVPVMVVGTEGDISPKQTIKRVVMPTPSGSPSEAVATVANAIADQTGASTAIVNTSGTLNLDATDLTDDQKEKASGLISGLLGQLKEIGVDLSDHFHKSGSVAVIDSLQSGDVIVVATQSAEKARKQGIDAEAAKLIKSGQAPVVTVSEL